MEPGAWYDRELFTLNGTKITPIHAAIFGTGTILIIILVVAAILSFIAYKKRKVLGREIHRISVVAQRLSTKIRKSISGRSDE